MNSSELAKFHVIFIIKVIMFLYSPAIISMAFVIIILVFQSIFDCFDLHFLKSIFWILYGIAFIIQAIVLSYKIEKIEKDNKGKE